MLSDIERLKNINIAQTKAYYTKTISVLCEERPGFDVAEAERIADLLRENGYFVKTVTSKDFEDKEFCKNDIGIALVIPHASSVPAVCAGKIKSYWEQGGIVLVLGGVLFAKYIAEVDGEWKELPLTEQEFDAAYSGKTDPIVIEGIVPTYKTYKCNNVTEFVAADNAMDIPKIKTDKPLRVVSPVVRSYGSGYKREYDSRFIPLVHTKGESPRNNGITGTAAFIMLNDTLGHLNTTAGHKLGTVLNTVRGSAVGCIGITEQNLMDIEGVPELIVNMINRMCKGLYIYEAGAEKIAYTDEKITFFGARVLNHTEYFHYATVRLTVNKGDKTVYSYEKKLLTAPANFTDFEFVCTDFVPDSYTVSTTLEFDGEIIDAASHTVFKYEPEVCTDKEEFISVLGDKFMLRNKEWRCAGINYWPLYYPSLETFPYWKGMFDKSNYIAEEVEKDLAFMSSVGINCVFIRIDGHATQRCDDTVKDFIMRCKKHGIKISLSYCNATIPFHCCGDAFRELMKLHGLINDPVIFSHDIAWEIGHQPLVPRVRYTWNEHWEKWLIERYGSLENAEKDFGFPLDRNSDGSIIIPPEHEITSDGEWRVKTAALRRFFEDHVSGIWNRAVRELKRIDPNHLIANRLGLFSPRCMSFTFALKHIDFNSLEGYTIALDEEDYHVSCANTAVMKALSNNKPVIWSEVGMSITGMRTTELYWDHENEEPFEYRQKMSTDYMSQFVRMFKNMDVNGVAPWWWPGGFRMVEMSDCGFCGPDGKLRPIGEVYSQYLSWLKEQQKTPVKPHIVEVDADADARGYRYMCVDDLKEENKRAEEKGEILTVVTEATGKTSAEVPLIAVGNVPYNGNNPLKYLNGEFNEVLLSINGDEYITAAKGAEICVPRNAEIKIKVSAGNIRQAKWLSPISSDKGGIYLCAVKESGFDKIAPLANDTDYLADGDFQAVLCDKINGKREFSLRFCLEDKAVFGECFKFTVCC